MPSDPRTRPRLVQRTREAIFDLIGRQCAMHDVDGEACDGPLEVDHPLGRDWVPRKVGSYERNRRYLKEALDGLLRPLCKHHNETIRPRARTLADDAGPQPF